MTPERQIPESKIAINPIVIDDSKREAMHRNTHTILDQHPLLEARERVGALAFYSLLFCYSYTFFGIFFVSYLWVLSHVFGYKIVGCLFGWCP